MKKLLLFLVLVLAISCSKDEVRKREKTLVGTEWVGVNDVSEMRITFYDSNSIVEIKSLKNNLKVTFMYDYIYTHPKVILNPRDKDLALMQGTMSRSNSMVMYNTSTNETIATVYKK